MGLHWRSNVHGGLAGRLAAPPPQDREGQFVWLAPNDVALAMLGHLRKIAGVTINASDRPKDGDYLFGAFGRAFGTLDGRRVMVVGLTKAQWTSLCTATGLGEELEAFGAWRGLD